MSLKEMQYSIVRNSTRLVAKSEAAYLASETNSSEVPAFLRRKASEGQDANRVRSRGERVWTRSRPSRPPSHSLSPAT